MSRGTKLAILLFYFTSICFAQNYSSRLFTKAQGLNDHFVYSVTQDSSGFLWINNSKGLSTFDGQMFFTQEAKTLKNEIIYASVTSPSGELWFGSSEGNLYSKKSYANKLIPFPKSCNASINKIISSQFSEDLFLNTVGNGVFIKQYQAIKQIKGSDEHKINGLSELNAAVLILATNEGLYAANITKDNLIKIANIEGAIAGIEKLKKSENTFLIYNSTNDFYQIKLTASGELVSLSRLPGLDSLKNKEIKGTSLVNDDQSFFINTSEAKLFIYTMQTQRLQAFNENNFSGIANSFYEDNEQNVWIGTIGNGLYRFSKTAYSFLNLSEPVYAITSSPAGLLYYGTNNGVLTHDRSANGITYSKGPGMPLGKITALYFQNNYLWTGTENRGLIVTNELNQKIELEFSPIKNISITSITGKESYVSVSTNLDGVYNYDGNQLKDHFSVRNSLLHNNVYNSLRSSTEKVFYATHNTSFNYSLKKQLYEINTKPLGLISDFNAFTENTLGEIFIATSGDGVYVLHGDTIKVLSENEHLDSKYCNGVICDAEDNLWITEQNNLYKYYCKEKILHKIEFSQISGLIFNPRAYHKNASGDLFFGTNKGVIKFKNDSTKNKLAEPYLLSVKLQDSIYTSNEAIFLTSGLYNVTFSFSALCLRNSEDIRFSYFLEGRDEVWSEPNPMRHAQFSKLAEGHYQFKVKVFNSDGLSSKEITLFTFDIAKPYWKSSLFWMLLTIAIIIVFILILKIRTTKLIHAKEKLEILVQLKTKELREEKELVEKSNLKIEEQNLEIKDSITYAKRIQDALLSGTDLFTNSKDMFVFFQPRDIVSGDFYWVAETGKVRVIVSADCTGHGVPGALMSMIGTTLLNKIVLEKKIVSPKQILSELDNEIKQALKQHTESATRDGMDICLVCVNLENKKAIYAGAMRPLFLVRNHQLIEYSPTKHAIGGFSYGKDKTFEEIEIDLQENDMFYLFSDGYADQFGGENGKKLMLKNFKKILISIAEMELAKQQENLKRVYNNWKGELDQIDDVLVIGFKIT
jgi:ligand-binding sensor domain-containing protein